MPAQRATVRFQGCWFAVLLAAVPRLAFAHPVSMSTAEIDVRRDRTNVELQVLVEELTLHYPVAANGEGVFSAVELRKHAQSHASFLNRDLLLLDGKGNRLECLATEVLADAISDKGVSETELKKLAVKYRFRFGPVGETGFLTASQTFGGKAAILPSIMDCMVFQEGVLADTPAQLLSGQAVTVKIDWASPPRPPKNWRELRDRRQTQLQERLGIASYGGLYSFIYVTPHEVRHEILVPLLTLEPWLPLKRRDPDFLEVEEQLEARKKIEVFFSDRNPVTIDGKVVKPIVDRVSFFELDIRDFAVNAKPRRVGVYQARVGIILAYPVSNSRTGPGPQRVALKWETYSKHAGFLRSIVYVHDGKPVEHFLRPDENTFSWQALKEQNKSQREIVPVVSRLKRAPQKLESEMISAEILRNVYRAFEYREEEAIYDALATSVDGPLLRTLYLQIRKSLLVAGQGDARSRIVEVRPVESNLKTTKADGFEVDLTWRAKGQIEHWGHIHSRENEYRARLSIAEKAGSWKLTGCRFLGQKRVRFQTRLRTK
jgi:hypothetical protein